MQCTILYNVLELKFNGFDDQYSIQNKINDSIPVIAKNKESVQIIYQMIYITIAINIICMEQLERIFYTKA